MKIKVFGSTTQPRSENGIESVLLRRPPNLRRRIVGQTWILALGYEGWLNTYAGESVTLANADAGDAIDYVTPNFIGQAPHRIHRRFEGAGRAYREVDGLHAKRCIGYSNVDVGGIPYCVPHHR